ncbi:MAG TPA: lipid-A-disaccharide synthase [bacterium]|nr:lipid-A-disaccharide synthase [bacterium]
MTKPIRVVVIGVGHLGQHHARIYSEMPDVELVGVVDIDEERSKRIAREYKTSAFSEHTQVLKRVDVASIAVPTELHYRISKDFLNAGVHILIEKPMTQTIEEADELLELAKRKNLVLQVGHIERFNPAVSALNRVIKEPRFIECHRLGPFKPRAANIGVVMDLMIHDIDIILSLVNSPVKRIEAVGIPVLSQEEDIANVRITFENGCIANLTASRVTKEETRKIRIFQRDAYLSLDYINQELSIYRREITPDGKVKILSSRPEIEKVEPLRLELEAFIRAIQRGQEPLVSGKEGREALAIVQEISHQIKPKKRIMILAGEASGDLQGAYLAQELKKLSPGIDLFGIGGRKMEKAGVRLISDITQIAVVGFVEVLKHIRTFRRILKKLDNLMEKEKPQGIILIDNPGFNLRVAKKAREENIPISYYISPQVWAWGRKRVRKITNLVKKMIVILPFEERIYQDAGCPVSFVGHPFLDIVRPTLSKKEAYERFEIEKNRPIIGLLPGSREGEIKRLLPVMIEAARRIREKIPESQFILPLAPTLSKERVNAVLKRANFSIKVVEDPTFDVRSIMDFALVASGSATLENACLGLPMLIVYKVHFTTWLLSKILIKIPYIGLVNVVAEKKVVPEFLQYGARPGRIADACLEILQDSKKLNEMRTELAKVKEKLGEPGAPRRAAENILETLEEAK